MTIDSWCWRSAIFPRVAARTPCSQTARASVPAKTRTKIASSRRIRRLACLSFMGSLLREIHVSVLRGVGVGQAELLRSPRLDLRGGELARQVRLQRGVFRAELRALGIRGIEREVESEHGHVHEYDAGEQNPADGDPEDPAACARMRALTRPRLRPWFRARLRAGARADDRLGDRRMGVREASQPSSPLSAAQTERAGCVRLRLPKD